MNTSNPFPVRAMKAHLALNVQNISKSIEFYRSMLGIEPSKVRADYAKFDVENPPLNLTLNASTTTDRGSLSHLGIQVASTEEVVAVRDAWRQAGLSVTDEMGTNCCYAIQDKAWVADPDGNEWEVFTVLEDVATTSTVCCVPTTAATSTVAATTAAASAETCCTPEVAAVCCPPATTDRPATRNRATAPATAVACCEPGSGCC